MPTPTIAEHRLLAAGAKKASTWRTAVALTSADGLLITKLAGLGGARNQPYVPAKTADTPYVKSGDLGLIPPVEFTLEFNMLYDPGALGMLLAMLFGTAGSPQQQGTTAYLHTIKWADAVFGKFVTLAAEFPGKIFEVASAKVVSFELTVEEGIIKGTIGLLGNIVIDDSTVNTATQLDALTKPDEENRVKFHHSSVKMNAQSAGDVASENALDVSGFTIRYARGFEGKHVAGYEDIVEPNEKAQGGPDSSIHLEFPRMDSVNAAYFQSCFKTQTPQKLLIACTGALIEASYNYEFNLFFPRARMLKPDYPRDEIVTAGLDLVPEEADSNPTGMEDKRPYVELQNKQSSDYLA